jgi:hypothetical protein
VCGNGIVEAGEPCDGSECCTPSCTFVANDTPCTDDGEVCTDDACSFGACVHDFDPTNDVSCAPPTSNTTTTTVLGPDDDSDGIPNTIDPCDSDPVDRGISSAKLKVNGVNRNTIVGDDDLVLTGSFNFFGTVADVDPATTGVRTLLYSDDAQLIADLLVPAGASWKIERHADSTKIRPSPIRAALTAECAR